MSCSTIEAGGMFVLGGKKILAETPKGRAPGRVGVGESLGGTLLLKPLLLRREAKEKSEIFVSQKTCCSSSQPLR